MHWSLGEAPRPRRRAVNARVARKAATAAVFTVPAERARRFGERPFSLFIVELPLRAACAPITVRVVRSEATERIRRRPKLCERRMMPCVGAAAFPRHAPAPARERERAG